MTMMDDAPRLTDDDLARVMDLIKDSDSVELKLTVPDAASLELDPLDAEMWLYPDPLTGTNVVPAADEPTPLEQSAPAKAKQARASN
jgi:hypothetical protein